ncbi:unnamed protein product [Prorocentrum cordatum]|uniref:Ion transport domain-containing protein n=1 Tax=Prorocentrum cordatum TaxID=2364126 RepID=A0ABN9TX68_9DINO|nr:unnamed protein product [Polarella glacialis]
MDEMEALELTETRVRSRLGTAGTVRPAPPSPQLDAGAGEPAEPVVTVPEGVGFRGLLELLSDLHDRKVKELEAEVASARELLVRPPRWDPPADLEPGELELLAELVPPVGPEREASCANLPGAVDFVNPPPLSPRSHDPAGPDRFPREFMKVVPSEQDQSAPVAEGSSMRRTSQVLLNRTTSIRARSKGTESDSAHLGRWADELAGTSSVMSFMDYLVDNDGRLGESRRGRIAYRLVKNVYFDALSYAFIIANSIFIGATMQHHLTCAIEGCTIDGIFAAVEIAFVVWFFVELLLKLLAEDVRVFLGPDRMWNTLDLVLVASAIGQLIAESDAPSIILTRNVRLFRVVSILRVFRVVRICQSLRVMINAILRSLDALFWVFAVLAFFMYIFAMAFMHAATEQFRSKKTTLFLECPTCSSELECAATCAHLKWLEDHFGSLFKVMLTLFQSLTGGLDWAEVYDQLHLIHGVHSFTFVVFIYFIVFLVMNVVTCLDHLESVLGFLCEMQFSIRCVGKCIGFASSYLKNESMLHVISCFCCCC